VGLILYGAGQQDALAKGMGLRKKQRIPMRLHSGKFSNMKRWIAEKF